MNLFDRNILWFQYLPDSFNISINLHLAQPLRLPSGCFRFSYNWPCCASFPCLAGYIRKHCNPILVYRPCVGQGFLSTIWRYHCLNKMKKEKLINLKIHVSSYIIISILKNLVPINQGCQSSHILWWYISWEDPKKYWYDDISLTKVSAIKVGHTLFTCFLFGNTQFCSFFHKNRYVCLFFGT